MTSSTISNQGVDEVVQHVSTPKLELRGLQRRMFALAAAAQTKVELLSALAQLLSEWTPTEFICYFPRGKQNESPDPIRLYWATEDIDYKRLTRQLASASFSACKSGEIELRRQAEPSRTIVSVPIPNDGQNPDAFAAVFRSDNLSDQLLLIAQLLASHLVL